MEVCRTTRNGRSQEKVIVSMGGFSQHGTDDVRHVGAVTGQAQRWAFTNGLPEAAKIREDRASAAGTGVGARAHRQLDLTNFGQSFKYLGAGREYFRNRQDVPEEKVTIPSQPLPHGFRLGGVENRFNQGTDNISGQGASLHLTGVSHGTGFESGAG